MSKNYIANSSSNKLYLLNDEGEADISSKLSLTIVISPRIEAESKSNSGSSQ